MVTITNTHTSEMDAVRNLFQKVIQFHKRRNHPVWSDIDTSTIHLDINLKRQFKIALRNEVLAVFTVLREDISIWGDRCKKDAIYLHRIAINPDFKGKKLFDEILEWAKRKAENSNVSFIRMDTWAENKKLIAYYMKFGFEKVDIIVTSDSEELPIQQRNNRVILLQLEIEPYS